MKEAGLDPQAIHKLTLASKKVYKLSKVPAKTKYTLVEERSKKVPRKLELRLTPKKTVQYIHNFMDNSWSTEIINHPTNIKVETFSGVVKDSLWNSASKSQNGQSTYCQVS